MKTALDDLNIEDLRKCGITDEILRQAHKNALATIKPIIFWASLAITNLIVTTIIVCLFNGR